jgi:hypothetical protein
MADPKTLHLLTTILEEVRGARADIAAFRTEAQRQHARTDEAIQEHDEAPGAHGDRIADAERRVGRLERKLDDES